MRNFSKSKLLALRQCAKRLWLELHRPDLREDSAATQQSFQTGHQVGDIARQIYDPENHGALINVQSEGFTGAFERTRQLIGTSQKPIFEAGFCAGGAMAFADVLLPVHQKGQQVWRMVEVKSSTSVKPYHRDDAAIQAFIARSAGVPLQAIALAHIDSAWVYPGGGDYSGLLVEVDLSAEAFSRSAEVQGWIKEAQSVSAMPAEPAIATGAHCDAPYACGFYGYCSRDHAKAQHPVHWLPYFGNKAQPLAEQGITELADVPDALLNAKQLRVKTHTLNNTVFFDATGAAADLAAYSLPAYFLDFETVQFAVPIWQDTRPYQFHVFQFSVHTLSEASELGHTEFLDVSSADPALALAQALIAACGGRGATGPVYVYNAAFETTRIKELAGRFSRLQAALLAINARVVDLLPIARERYYHPSQQGSWSIKKVLPAIAPELRYDALEGVQDGGMAMDAFLEAIHPETWPTRQAQIQQQLLSYCKLDTYAMVRLWQVFAGRADLKL